MPGTLKVNYWFSLLIFFKFNYNPTGKYMFKVINKNNRFKKLQWAFAVNPFATNAAFLYPLKTSENLRFSDVFRG